MIMIRLLFLVSLFVRQVLVLLPIIFSIPSSSSSSTKGFPFRERIEQRKGPVSFEMEWNQKSQLPACANAYCDVMSSFNSLLASSVLVIQSPACSVLIQINIHDSIANRRPQHIFHSRPTLPDISELWDELQPNWTTALRTVGCFIPLWRKQKMNNVIIRR